MPPRLCTVLLVATAACDASGGGLVGVGSNGLQAIVDTFQPVLVSEIKKLKVPDIKKKVHGFDVHMYDMAVKDFNCKDACIVPSFSHGGKVSVSIPGFDIKFHIRASVKKSFLHVATKCDSKIGTAKLSASGTLSASGGKLSLGSVDASADVGKIDPKCSGGLSGEIIDLISGIFDDTIKDQLNKLLEQTIKKELGTEAARILSGISWIYPIEKSISADFSPQAVASTSGHLSLDVRAAIVDPAGDEPSVPRPALPSWSAEADDAYLQILLSEWSLDSAGLTYWNAGRMQANVSHTDVSKLVPIPLNTTSIGLLCAPGLLVKYPHHWMAIEAAISTPPLSRIRKAGPASQTPGDVTVNAPATFIFNVVDPSGHLVDHAFTVGTNLSAGLTFAIGPSANTSGQALTAEITHANFPLVVVSSDVGAVKLAGLSNFTNGLVNHLLIPLANSVLKRGIPLPSTPVITATHTKLQPDDGYLLVSTQFEVKPP